MKDASSYLVNNQRQIIVNLSILIKNKCLVSVRFVEGRTFFLTALLAIDEQNQNLIFDSSPKPAQNEKLANVGKAIFEADFAGIKVSFRGNDLKSIDYDGAQAFSMPIPESMFWMQRREYFRIKSPQSKKSHCLLYFENREPIKLPIYDISLTGFSMLNTSTEISNLLPSGDEVEQARLVLTGAGEDFISFRVCTKFIINPDKIAALKIQKIGCLFTKISRPFETTVQRYINQLQREGLQKHSDN